LIDFDLFIARIFQTVQMTRCTKWLTVFHSFQRD